MDKKIEEAKAKVISKRLLPEEVALLPLRPSVYLSDLGDGVSARAFLASWDKRLRSVLNDPDWFRLWESASQYLDLQPNDSNAQEGLWCYFSRQ